MAQSKEYQFPTIYNFPPFYTKQPNLKTYETQLSHWERLILEYCQFNKIWALSLTGQQISALGKDDLSDGDDDDDEIDVTKSKTVTIFKNDKIDRSLNSEFIMEIYNKMITEGKAAWMELKNHKSGIFVYWHSLEEWSDIISEFFENTGQEGTVLTLYEIRNGDLTMNQEFSGMNETLLIRVLEVMQKRGQCQLLKDEDGGVAGVKV